jgi:Ca-activated chloride channel family protein
MMPAFNHSNRRFRVAVCVWLAAAVPLAVSLAWAQPAKSGQARRAREGEEAQIRVEVNLVTVLASVTDANGRPIPDLPHESFEIYEEGVKQKLELFDPETSQPLDIVLMVDTSMSTSLELDYIKEAAARFIRQVVRPGDRMAIFEFDSAITQLSEFTADVRDLRAAVRDAMPGSGTSLYDAVYLGSGALIGRPAGRRRVLVLITDAGETTSNATFEVARRGALRSEALLYTVIINPVRGESGRNTAGEHALLTITDVTGGVMFKPESPDDLGAIFDRIDRELRTQYRLGYYPEPRPPARSQRRIEVRIVAPPADPRAADRAVVTKLPAGFVVRHRRGYLTGPFE